MNSFNRRVFDIKLVVILLVVTMLPSFIFVAFDASSLAFGMLISSGIVFILNYNLIKNIRFNKTLLTAFILVSILLLIQSLYIFISLSVLKPLNSFSIVFIVGAAAFLASKIETLGFEEISRSFLVAIIFLLFLGWIKVFYIPYCCNYMDYVKPVFPFSEESHYALAVGMLSVSFSTVGSLVWVFFIAINIFILAFIFPSLTLLIFGLLIIFASLLRLKPIYFKSTLLLLPVFIVLVFFGLLSSSEYFISRLTFQNTTNLTTLVYLQGWDFAYVNFIETQGLGIGFQMLGSSFANESQFTQEIVQNTGRDYNLSDGGFLASKIISEFGVIGVVLLLSYLLFVIKFLFYGNKILSIMYLGANKGCRDVLKKDLLMSGIALGFFVEMFLRGYGYFSPGVFLFLTAVFYLSRKRSYGLKLLL